MPIIQYEPHTDTPSLPYGERQHLPSGKTAQLKFHLLS